MLHFDALSRAPVDQNDSDELTERSINVFSIVDPEEEILMYQYTDKKLRRKTEILRNLKKKHSKHELRETRDYELRNGILYKRVGEKLLYVIPVALRKSMVIRFHDLQSHSGINRTLAKLREYYFFPGTIRYLRQHVRSCE